MEPSEVSDRLRAIASVVDAQESPSLSEVMIALRGVLAAVDDFSPRSKKVAPPKALPGGSGWDPSGGNIPEKPSRTVTSAPYIPDPDKAKGAPKAAPEYVPSGKRDPRGEMSERQRRDKELSDLEERRKDRVVKDRLDFDAAKEREERAKADLQKKQREEFEKGVRATPEYASLQAFNEYLDGFDRDAIDPQERLRFCKLHGWTKPEEMKQFDEAMEAMGKHVVRALPGDPIRAPRGVLEKAANQMEVTVEDVRKFIRSQEHGGELVDTKAIVDAMNDWLTK